MQGTIIKVAVEEGQEVAAGDLIVVLEAMKMEQPVSAHKPGTVASLTAEPGATIASGAAICDILLSNIDCYSWLQNWHIPAASGSYMVRIGGLGRW